MEEQFYSAKDLISQGWTASMIDKILSSPDKTTLNPHFSGGARMRWYNARRVDQISTSIQATLAQNRHKRSTRHKPEQKASLKLHLAVEKQAAQISIPSLSKEQLLAEISRAHSTWAPDEENITPPNFSWDKKDPLRDRLCLDYLAYITIAKYDTWLYEKTAGHSGGLSAKKAFYATLWQKIHQAYPYLEKSTTPSLITDLLP